MLHEFISYAERKTISGILIKKTFCVCDLIRDFQMLPYATIYVIRSLASINSTLKLYYSLGHNMGEKVEI